MTLPAPKASTLAPTSKASCELPGSLTVIGVAEACRASALEFVNGVAKGWGKAELAQWLEGRYRTLTRFSYDALRDSERMLQGLAHCAEARQANSPRARVRPGRVEQLMQATRIEVIAAFRATLTAGEDFGFDALASGHLMRCVDRNGAPGWVPVDLPRMRLAERVSSLIAVDYLTRPAEYEAKFIVCARCEQPIFDREARARGACRSHADSGIRTPNDAGLYTFVRSRTGSD